MSLLAPSILAADFSNLTQQIRAAELGHADLIHCDVMDGIFVPNISFGPMIVKTVKKITKLPLDVHLMIKQPDLMIPAFIDAGANYITVHQEEVVHLDKVLNSIKQLGAKAGIAINPATPIETILPVLHLADLVLVMSVNPGFGGQSFIDYTLEKIKVLAEIKKEKKYKFFIQVDGGINAKNIKLISEAGCDILVAGSAVFNNEDITAATTNLKNLIT